MAEGTKVRLVRCPKCENLLQELPNLAVYQCGGCGAVLQAKKRSPSSVVSSEKSDEERVRVSFEKSESFSEKVGVVNLDDASEILDRDTDGLKLRRRGWEGVLERTADSNSSSSPMTPNREVVNENMAASRYDRRNVEQETEYGSKYRRSSNDRVDNWVIGNNQDMGMNRDKEVRVNMEKDIGQFKPHIEVASGSRSSSQIPNWRRGERGGTAAYRRIPRAVVEGVRFSTSPYPDDGPSNHREGSAHGYREPIKNQNNLDASNRVEYLEQDRAVLLRKLDELKNQLSRSCEVSDKPKERVPVDRTVPPDTYVGCETWFPEGSSGLNRASLQPFPADKHVQRHPYFNRGREPVSLMNRHDMDMQNFYPPPVHASNEILGYGDLLGPQICRRAPNQPTRQYPQQSSHDYFSGQYMDIGRDPVASYPDNSFFHQPVCSCLHCHNKHWQVPAKAPPAVFCDRRFVDTPTNPMFYHPANPGTFGPQGYNPRGANPPPLYSHELQPHPRRLRDLDAEMGDFDHRRLQREALSKKNGRCCHPIAGGAPFITCYNCFELLQLPRKLILMENNQRKLRCGACSTVISFVIESKRLVVSIPAQTEEISPEVNDGSAEVVKGLLHSQGHANRDSLNYSDDYDNSGYNYQSTDTEPFLSSMDERLNLSESEKMQGLLSSSSFTSDDEESIDGVIARREVSNSEETLKVIATPPLPGSPLHDRFEYSSSDKLVSKSAKGNRSKRMDQGKVVLTKATSRQKSVKDASEATEMEVSFNEYSNTGTSQGSGEVTREEDRIGKGGDSFFAGLIKKSFTDFSRSNKMAENGSPKVSINGKPIPEQLVKKAEKQAGPIHPGQYWYDFRAGFWGVMGQPCLGIIPPFIEEFSYPMPKNCAAGNTGVFVNGRELNQKDLNLLASRGLPTATDKSYVIEISGRVLDEDSGEELDSLGKLAPTVLKVKRGFGMRVPRASA